MICDLCEMDRSTFLHVESSSVCGRRVRWILTQHLDVDGRWAVDVIPDVNSFSKIHYDPYNPSVYQQLQSIEYDDREDVMSTTTSILRDAFQADQLIKWSNLIESNRYKIW